MTKLRTLFPTKNAYAGATTVNPAGAPAFIRSLEERTVQVLMVGNLEGTFYASAGQLAREAVDTLTEISDRDPEFLAKAIVYARNEGYLRIAPIVGLLVLSKARPDLFRRIFRRVILQPGDLQDFVTLARSKSVRSSAGRSVRSAVGDWMNSISPYHVVKYGAPQKKPGAGSPVNLRDILRLARPVPAPGMDEVFKYIILRIKGETIPQSLFSKLPEQIKAYESFKTLTSGPVFAKDAERKALDLVEKYDLPYEVVLARLSSPEAWKTLAKGAPFMNMLRNLNNYEKNGVFKDAEVLRSVVSRLRDPEQIRKSKQFPFRFLSAYNAFTGAQEVREALVDAVELSIANIPELGRVLVGTDNSGSMDAKISEHSEITMRQIGNLFAAALWKRGTDGYMVPFATRAYPVGFDSGAPQVNRKDSIVTIAQKLAQVDGGTYLSAPLDWALGRDFDTGVFITDNISWYDHLHHGHGVLDSIRRYRARRPKAQFFFIQLVGYQQMQVPQTEPGVHYIYGWSDNVLRYIGNAVSGANGQVAAVRGVSLDAEKQAEKQAEKPSSKRKPAKAKTKARAKARRPKRQ